MLDVTPILRPERAVLLELLGSLTPAQWDLPTECPAYTVKGLATHVLGDDLSLLSRQRDAEVNGLLIVAAEMPGADFRTLLDAFNDRWVSTARFFSPSVLIDLLQVSGESTADFYEAVDLAAPCEPVGFFGAAGELSPYWQAIAREYVERWVHHSQVRRALGLRSLAEEPFLRTGVDVIAAAGQVDPSFDGTEWSLGPVRLGDAQQTADLLTRAHTTDEVRGLVSGPPAAIELLASTMGR